MKHTIATKFLAFLLAACAFAAALVCGGYAFLLESYNLYDITPEEKVEQWYMEAGYPVAWRAASEAAALGPGECSPALAEQLFGFSLDEENYYIVVRQGDEVVHTISEPIPGGFTCEYSITPQYPRVVDIYPAYTPDTSAPGASSGMVENPQATAPVLPGIEPVRIEKVDVWEDLQKLIYELHFYEGGPTYTVSVTMAPPALQDTFYSNLTTFYPYRNTLIWGAALALMLAAALVVYLICAAGRTADGQVCPGGLNKLPLDVYGLLACGLGAIPLKQALNLYNGHNSLTFLTGSLLVLYSIIVIMLALAVIFAVAAQIKVGKGHWWRHSVLGMGILALIKGVSALLSKMNIIWQWLLVTVVMLVLTGVSFAGAVWHHWKLPMTVLFTLCCLGFLIVIGYGGWCFAMIVSGARKMAGGQLDHKIPTGNMGGSFRDCAEQLNSLSETTMQAVQSQVRSERMKTELITNVSHDIKTPLTSIINFVDLLSRPHSKEDEKQYLEVLSRQSLQLKKLIEDLMELSKASSGNLQANIIPMDAAEAVNQALGEFSDKLEKVQLTPVFYQPAEPVMIAADGRLTWRVLSNLLSNAVKYATPGTRVYVDISKTEDKVLLSIKNVSREELRYSAEELMERFVRGDASRNREGSGLGLNIAKTLMEVQHGSLQLTLDGDLFKVTLTFPAAEE